MPSLAMTVPYLRTSPLHIPRRDLVLAAADSLFLRVTIVDSDTPCAQAIELSGGIGGAGAQFIVWADMPEQHFWDYGTAIPVTGQLLSSVAGTLSDALGAFDFSLPSGTMSTWPRRCGWCVQLNYDTTGAQVLMSGRLHMRRLGTAYLAVTPILMTDDFIPIHTDLPTEEQVEA
jgi:hypothetical protein